MRSPKTTQYTPGIKRSHLTPELHVHEKGRRAGGRPNALKKRLHMDPIESSSGRQGSTLLEVVLEYHRRGWCIIPIKTGTKLPACRKWKGFQTERPTEATLRRWFRNRADRGLAVIMGEVSGGLVCRDFDKMDSYQQWADEHPDLALTLPTVATARGRHVYCNREDRENRDNR